MSCEKNKNSRISAIMMIQVYFLVMQFDSDEQKLSSTGNSEIQCHQPVRPPKGTAIESEPT